MLYPFVYQVFIPISEFSALTPTPSFFLSNTVEVSAFVPSFPNVPKRFPSFYVLRLLLFLGPTCLVHFTVTLQGKFRLLTLSYLVKNDCPFGSLTRCGITHLLKGTPMQIENLPICSCSYKGNALKISHSQS